LHFKSCFHHRVIHPPPLKKYADNLSSKTAETYCYDYGWNPSNAISLIPGYDPWRPLCGDIAAYSITFYGDWPTGNIIQLNGYGIYIGEGGFSMVGNTGGLALQEGYVTSLSNYINIDFESALISFRNTICNNGNTKVGLNITQAGSLGVELTGSSSNTFTGNSYISGSNSKLTLNKSSGYIAMSGDLTIKNGAVVPTANSDQFASNIRVTLQSSGDYSRLVLGGRKESFRELFVDGNGILKFDVTLRFTLDDLYIKPGSELLIEGFSDKVDLFLVRKSSVHVRDSLKYISFNGHTGLANLKDYNKDYWRISSTPEPSNYGVLFSVFGLGIVGLRKHRNRQKLRFSHTSA